MSATTTSKDAPVLERIERKREVLQDWATNGVPDGFEFPLSLAKCRTWEIPQLGVWEIGSKREWNKKNRKYTGVLGLIDVALTTICENQSGAKRTTDRRPLGVRFDELKEKYTELQEGLDHTLAAWHAERRKREAMDKERRISNEQAKHYLARWRESQADVAELRRRLFESDGLRTVK